MPSRFKIKNEKSSVTNEIAKSRIMNLFKNIIFYQYIDFQETMIENIA